jgi:putative tryptophan/tyrosine transport system substrate-binding protein
MARTAHYVVRILDGARPVDLPMEQPTLNLRTARTLGIEVPALLLTMVGEVIE